MKKIILLFIGLSLFTCKSSSFKEVPEKDKIRILIAKANPEIYKLVKEKFESTGQFRIISPDDQDKALYKLKDCSTKDCTFELGKVLFAKLLLTYTTETVLQGDYTLYSYKIADVSQGVYLASSYDIVYSAGEDKYKKIYVTLNSIQSIDMSNLKVDHDLLINKLIESLEKSFENKKKKPHRMIFTKYGFFEEAFKCEIIGRLELELIDDLTIEKTLSQLKKKQQYGAEDYDIQLGKIFLAQYIFSNTILFSNNKGIQVSPKIFSVQNASFFKSYYEDFYIKLGEEFVHWGIANKLLSNATSYDREFRNIDFSNPPTFTDIIHLEHLDSDKLPPSLPSINIRKRIISKLIDFKLKPILGDENEIN